MNASINPKVSPRPASAAPHLPFFTSVKGVADWLEQLPHDNPAKYCRQLYAALKGINAQPLSALHHLQLLERLRTPLLDQARHFEPFFLDQRFPLEEKAFKMTRLAIHFQVELAEGYMSLIRDHEFEAIFAPAQQATALHRALQAHGMLLLLISQVYEAPPERLWENMNQLYALAERLRLTDVAVYEFVEAFASSSSTPADVLRRTLAFHLANPTRLPQRQIGDLFRFLDENTHLIGLHLQRDGQGQETRFYLDLTGTSPPRHISQLTGPHPGIRYLTIHPMLTELMQMGVLGAPFDQRVALLLGKGELLGRLEPWSGRRTTAIVGVQGVAVLCNLAPPQIGQLQRALADGEGNALSLAPRRQVGLAVSPATEDIWKDADPAALAARQAFDCHLRYAGPEGYCLIGTQHDKAGTGEVIGFLLENRQVAVGILRARKPTLDGARDVGEVEILSHRASTVGVYYVAGESRRKIQGVLITDQPDSEYPATLLLPSISLPAGAWITVEQDGQWRNYRLAKLIESAPDFRHYQLYRPRTGQAVPS
jgi:hypothetical protein